MNTKSDKEQLTIERMRNVYPNLTVEGSSSLKSNTVSSTTTTTPSLLTKIPAQQSIATVSTTSDRSNETKLVAEKRKIPPYTNSSFHNSGSSVKVNKANIKNTIAETPSNEVLKKQGSSVPNIKATVNSVNPNTRVPIVKPEIIKSVGNKTEKTCQALKSSNEKPAIVSYLKVNDSINSHSLDIKDQIKQISSSISSDVLEKNIQNKALTVLSIPSSPAISSSSNEKKTPLSFGKNVNTGKSSNNVELFKPPMKTMGVRPSVDLSEKSISPRILTTTAIQGVSKANSTTINVSEVSKNIQAKSAAATEVATAVSPKQQLTVTSSTSVSPAETTASAKQTAPAQVSPRIVKHATAVSVTPISNSQAVPQESVQANLRGNSSITVFLSSLSEPDRSKNGILDAINAGNNVNVTQSVTISKTAILTGVLPVVVQQSAPEQRSRLNATTDITQKTHACHSPSAYGNLRKNNTVTDMSSRSQSPGVDTSQEAISSVAAADHAKFESSSYLICSNETEANEETNSPKKNASEEPECLTISSDEESEEDELLDKNEISVSVSNKEPPLTAKNEKLMVAADGSICETDEESALDVTSGEGYVSLNCRTIRIGSYKLSPVVPVVLSKYGLRIVIPCSNTSCEIVVLKIPFHEITRILIHFGRSVPVIFYYVTDKMGMKVRRILKMNDPEDVYFDPSSLNESQRRITLLPEIISDTNRINICELFKDTKKMFELSQDEANQILVRSAPKEVQRIVKQVPDPVQTIMVFPPPPAKGGISINTEDYACLEADVFLNDVIIDFYLKYLYLNHLSEEDREKTHIFSSFFYKRLTDKATPIPRHLKSSGSVMSPAEIRHNRVKNWTKNIDIFSKDYIVIPLNENQHWFLAIICFPGLRGPVRFSDNKPIEVESKEQKVSNLAEESSISGDSEKPSSSMAAITITPVKLESKERTKIYLDDDNDVEDRDEAEATDEDVNISEEDTEEEYLFGETEEILKRRCNSEREPIKQPCILIFDSLAGASRARIIATLRDYLRIEYKVKHGEERDFSKNVVRGAVPAVPQQDNFTDCGLFVLQYVESFFDDKITDYHIPIKTLKNWFPAGQVGHKRAVIQRLLHDLMKAQNIDIESLNLPLLHLQTSDDDDDDYYDSEYEGEEYPGTMDDYEDYDIIELRDRRPRYHGYMDEEEVYDEEEEDDSEMMGVSRYTMFNESDDECPEDMDSDEDNSDDVYKDLDDVEVTKNREYRRKIHRRMDSVRCFEGLEDEEEMDEEEIGTHNDEDEQQLSSDIEEKINNSNLNRETVSIKLTSVSSRMQSPAGGSGASVVTSTTPTIKPASTTDLAKLKAARPWGPVEQSKDDCSTTKKFKHN